MEDGRVQVNVSSDRFNNRLVDGRSFDVLEIGRENFFFERTCISKDNWFSRDCGSLYSFVAYERRSWPNPKILLMNDFPTVCLTPLRRYHRFTVSSHTWLETWIKSKLWHHWSTYACSCDGLLYNNTRVSPSPPCMRDWFCKCWIKNTEGQDKIRTGNVFSFDTLKYSSPL